MKRTSKKKFPLHILLFLLPALLVYTVFSIYPLFSSLLLSFFEVEQGVRSFTGLDNYIALLTLPEWTEQLSRALINSFVYFLVNMFVQNPIALLLATLLATKTKASSLYRTLFYMPVTLSLIAVAFVWQMLLNPTWGIVEGILDTVGLGSLFAPYLGQESTALITLALISSWQNIGVPILLYYASLIAIPGDVLEAAMVDGASTVRVFFSIKIPLIAPMIATISLMTYIFNFNAFDMIFAIKGPLAGPNFSTDTMMSFFFRTFYGHEFNTPNPAMGTTIAATIFIIMLLGVLIYTLIKQRIQKKIDG